MKRFQFSTYLAIQGWSFELNVPPRANSSLGAVYDFGSGVRYVLFRVITIIRLRRQEVAA